MTEAQARQLAQDFRLEFRNSEAFEAAWRALYELKAAITLPLAKRFLGEELLKFRTKTAGLEAADFFSSAPPKPRPEAPFLCPGCKRSMGEWQRDGHAPGCPHAGFYALEVRCRIAITRRNEQKAREKLERSLVPEPPPRDERQQADEQHPAHEQHPRENVQVHAGHPL